MSHVILLLGHLKFWNTIHISIRVYVLFYFLGRLLLSGLFRQQITIAAQWNLYKTPLLKNVKN